MARGIGDHLLDWRVAGREEPTSRTLALPSRATANHRTPGAGPVALDLIDGSARGSRNGAHTSADHGPHWTSNDGASASAYRRASCLLSGRAS